MFKKVVMRILHEMMCGDVTRIWFHIVQKVLMRVLYKECTEIEQEFRISLMSEGFLRAFTGFDRL